MDQKKIIRSNEIDLIELTRFIWSQRKFFLKTACVFFILGLFIAFATKIEYKATCKLLPEDQEGGLEFGGLGGLAGLAGVDLSGLGTSAVLSPEMYPEIVQSAPFLNGLINTPIYFENVDSTVSSYTYFKEINQPSIGGLIVDYTLGLPKKLRSWLDNTDSKELKDYNLVRFSKEDWEILEEYKDRLSISVDSKTTIINVSVEMPDPVAAAFLADLLVNELTQTVTNYKISKFQSNLDFVKERFEECKIEYKKKQEQLALFADRNRNISNSTVQTEYERLQNELNIAYEVYKGLATQLEQSKIKVKEETPVFAVLEPVRVPEEKSKPKRILIIVLTTMISIPALMAYYFGKTVINMFTSPTDTF